SPWITDLLFRPAACKAIIHEADSCRGEYECRRRSSWVRSGHDCMSYWCPLYPQKRTLVEPAKSRQVHRSISTCALVADPHTTCRAARVLKRSADNLGNPCRSSLDEQPTRRICDRVYPPIYLSCESAFELLWDLPFRRSGR